MGESIENTELYGLLLHPSAPRVLMLLGAKGWSLPHATLNEALWLAEAGKVSKAMQQALGAELTVLRCVSYHDGKETQSIEAVYVLENHDLAWQPRDSATWVGQVALTTLPLAHPEQQALIAAYLAGAESGQVPELRPPWARAGWFSEAAAWMRSELESLGYSLTSPVEQVKSWGISCILRARTTSGNVYFKVASSLPLFAHEPLLTQALASLYPKHIPTPLSIDAQRRWMLLTDFGDAIGWDAPTDVQAEMLRVYSELQRDAVSRIDTLLAMGCLDRRLESLAAQVDPLLEDSLLLSSQLDAAEIEKLREFGPRLKALCAELAGYAIPATLVHGDLHLGNVARPAGSFLFFDWTDACIAHPFFDTISILQAEDLKVQASLRDSYLNAWRGYEAEERLLEAWELAKPLSALHQAVSYQHIVATLEGSSTPELASGLAYWLRKLLQSL